MFELFMIGLFAAAGMLLGNLVFNCLIALSDRLESYYDVNNPNDNY